MTCCTLLQKEYYEMVEAPEKKFFLYEGCAHSPIYEDGERTREILNELLKADNGTRSGHDQKG